MPNYTNSSAKFVLPSSELYRRTDKVYISEAESYPNIGGCQVAGGGKLAKLTRANSARSQIIHQNYSIRLLAGRTFALIYIEESSVKEHTLGSQC